MKNSMKKVLMAFSVLATPVAIAELVDNNEAHALEKGWVKASNQLWYFYENNGLLARNKWIGNYYLQADGSMATSKWVDNGKYYVDENGAWVQSIKKGWVKASTGLWYFYENNGLLARNKWIGNYYLQADGSMATNKWVDNNKYFVDNEGKWVENTTKNNKYESTASADTSIYYNQRDTRWNGLRFGSYTFGATGCVPTSLAMILSSSLNRTVTPVEVGRYLYNNTNTFNKIGMGSSGQAIVNVANAYGLNINGLKTSAEIKEALQRGHSVIAAVNGGTVFANYGYTHAIVLTGYKNGATYVKDPYNSKNNKWFNVNYLQSIGSLDPYDRQTGYVFHEIY